MNWDAVGAIGEITGAIAVIVTIGYLALQMRQNTRSVQSAAAQQILEGLAELNQFLGSDPQINDLWWRGLQHPESLSDEELNRLLTLASSLIQRFELLFLNHRQGFVPREVWEAQSRNMERVFGTPGIQRWFSEFGSGIHTEFREYIEARTGT